MLALCQKSSRVLIPSATLRSIRDLVLFNLVNSLFTFLLSLCFFTWKVRVLTPTPKAIVGIKQDENSSSGPAHIWLSVNVSNCQLLFSLLHILHSSWSGLSNILRMCYFVQALVPFPSVSLNPFPSGPSAQLTAPLPTHPASTGFLTLASGSALSS